MNRQFLPLRMLLSTLQISEPGWRSMVSTQHKSTSKQVWSEVFEEGQFMYCSAVPALRICKESADLCNHSYLIFGHISFQSRWVVGRVELGLTHIILIVYIARMMKCFRFPVYYPVLLDLVGHVSGQSFFSLSICGQSCTTACSFPPLRVIHTMRIILCTGK